MKAVMTLDDVAASARPSQPAEDVSKKKEFVHEAFGCEEIALRQAKRHIADAEDELSRQYPRIDMESVLGLTKRQRGIPFPVPRFGLFSLDKSELSMTVMANLGVSGTNRPYGNYDRLIRRKWKAPSRDACETIAFVGCVVFVVAAIIGGVMLGIGAFAPETDFAATAICSLVPWGIAAIAALVIAMALRLVGRRSDTVISAEFSGVIPHRLRATIKQLHLTHKNKEGDGVYLLAEVPQWKATPAPIPVGDPLVILRAKGRYYLVDKFDTTTLEHYIASEFTS
jgi:hypothetical protein